jgi:glycosyltransferase involved in cell wall biosynthesis
MPTKILDFELRAVPSQISGLERYSAALVLLRSEERPVLVLTVPLRHGVFRRSDLRERLAAGWGGDLHSCWSNLLLPPPPFEVKPNPPGVTVAICTRNRPEDLIKCLNSLVKLPEDGQEILVIDNCPSNDASEQLVRRFPSVRYVRENRPGLDCARNRALREARGQIIAFIDDDAVADKNWLRRIAEPCAEPLTLCVTGLSLPVELETESQEEFERLAAFGRGFVRKRFSVETNSPTAGGAAGVGANMALRKDVLAKVGGFDEALDAGTGTHSGGDSDMFSRIIAAGYDVMYEPAALNWHRHRRTREELRRAMFGYGVGIYAAWTRSFLVEKEWDVFKAFWYWFVKVQLKNAVRSLLRRRGAYPLDLIWEELRGSVWGPVAYLLATQEIPPPNEPKE